MATQLSLSRGEAKQKQQEYDKELAAHGFR
jgi:hypothetical protein